MTLVYRNKYKHNLDPFDKYRFPTAEINSKHGQKLVTNPLAVIEIIAIPIKEDLNDIKGKAPGAIRRLFPLFAQKILIFLVIVPIFTIY